MFLTQNLDQQNFSQTHYKFFIPHVINTAAIKLHSEICVHCSFLKLSELLLSAIASGIMQNFRSTKD